MGKRRNKVTGNIGEDIASEILKQKGYQILHRNFRCRFGEIDIVARDGPVIVFVEVKTRKGRSFGEAEEAVNYFKQMKLRQLAEYYLLKHNAPSCNCRFDVYSIYLDSEDQLQSTRVMENCF